MKAGQFKKIKVCISDRCFFPWSAFRNSKKIVDLAKDLGYEGIEFHPTWAVCLEVLLNGKLSCQTKKISSFHIDWCQDTIHDGYKFFTRDFLKPTHQLFPPSFLATRVLQKLEKKYKKQVVIHWLENIEQYKNPILELHSLLPIGLGELEEYFEVGKIKGIVIDTHKFSGWMRFNKLKRSSEEILKKLIKQVSEVHFRFKYEDDVKALSGNKETDTIRIMKQLIKLGYQERVVIEAGWPDAGEVSNLWRIDMVKTKKIHTQIISFLKTIV